MLEASPAGEMVVNPSGAIVVADAVAHRLLEVPSGRHGPQPVGPPVAADPPGRQPDPARRAALGHRARHRAAGARSGGRHRAARRQRRVGHDEMPSPSRPAPPPTTARSRPMCRFWRRPGSRRWSRARSSTRAAPCGGRRARRSGSCGCCAVRDPMSGEVAQVVSLVLPGEGPTGPPPEGAAGGSARRGRTRAPRRRPISPRTPPGGWAGRCRLRCRPRWPCPKRRASRRRPRPARPPTPRHRPDPPRPCS